MYIRPNDTMKKKGREELCRQLADKAIESGIPLGFGALSLIKPTRKKLNSALEKSGKSLKSGQQVRMVALKRGDDMFALVLLEDCDNDDHWGIWQITADSASSGIKILKKKWLGAAPLVNETTTQAMAA